jgi:hypothetical protein
LTGTGEGGGGWARVRLAVWLRRHWNAYVETGKWPLESFPKY